MGSVSVGGGGQGEYWVLGGDQYSHGVSSSVVLGVGWGGGVVLYFV